tara:strand:+ start:850 stop:1608 length:759 start_codon:yes stop_codon:yes gene_type:complete
MEPQIIDYYNEIPNGINVIDKMNEELSELQKKYSDLEKKINKFKTPFIHVETKEEYKKYEDIICNQFKNKINEFLKDEETGIFELINIKPIHNCHPDTLYDDFSNGLYWYSDKFSGVLTPEEMKEKDKYMRKENCKWKIINELNKITKNVNKEWCELRIELAFKLSLKKYPSIRYKELTDKYEMIEDLIHHIFNDEDCDYLPEIYLRSCKEHSLLEYCESLNSLICYNCKICDVLSNYYDGELLCVDCRFNI